MALDSDQYTPPALAPELADKIAGYLEQMEIEAAREEHKIKFHQTRRFLAATPCGSPPRAIAYNIRIAELPGWRAVWF